MNKLYHAVNHHHHQHQGNKTNVQKTTTLDTKEAAEIGTS